MNDIDLAIKVIDDILINLLNTAYTDISILSLNVNTFKISSSKQSVNLKLRYAVM